MLFGTQAIPFKRFRKLRVLFLTSSGGIIAPSHSEIITLLQTFADVVFSDVIFSREQKPRLEYLKVARWGGIYQPVKSEEGRYKFKLVEHKWAESIFEGW